MKINIFLALAVAIIALPAALTAGDFSSVTSPDSYQKVIRTTSDNPGYVNRGYTLQNTQPATTTNNVSHRWYDSKPLYYLNNTPEFPAFDEQGNQIDE